MLRFRAQHHPPEKVPYFFYPKEKGLKIYLGLFHFGVKKTLAKSPGCIQRPKEKGLWILPLGLFKQPNDSLQRMHCAHSLKAISSSDIDQLHWPQLALKCQLASHPRSLVADPYYKGLIEALALNLILQDMQYYEARCRLLFFFLYAFFYEVKYFVKKSVKKKG